jgi:Uma2 family endonuclease
MSALAKLPEPMSVHDFLSWVPSDGRMWQLVDGEPQAMAPPNRTHGTLQGELGSIIRNHLQDKDSPRTLVVTPGVLPHVQAAHNMRVPDLAVTCSDYEAEETGLTDPVLIVGILSPSNQAETWANVWAYTTIPSVREILLLRTAAIRADLLRRGPDGTWPREPAIITEGDLALDSIGLRTPLAGLYRSTRLRRSPGS